MATSAANNVFHVVAADALDAARDVFLGLPVDGNNKLQQFHRIPLRSSLTETDDDRRVRVQLLSPNVVQTTRTGPFFPSLMMMDGPAPPRGCDACCCSFRAPTCRPSSDTATTTRVATTGQACVRRRERQRPPPPHAWVRGNCTMGFALFDHRSGPTEEEQRVMANIDRLAAFVRRTMFSCERIRTTLKLGPAHMSPEQQQVAARGGLRSRMITAGTSSCHFFWEGGGWDRARLGAADMMDLHVARPQSCEAHGRYCYVKLVLPDSNAHEMFHTYFWTPDGTRIPVDVVEGYRNFQAVPFVEVEDVFVSKAVRSLQLKLRECIVCPLPEVGPAFLLSSSSSTTSGAPPSAGASQRPRERLLPGTGLLVHGNQRHHHPDGRLHDPGMRG